MKQLERGLRVETQRYEGGALGLNVSLVIWRENYPVARLNVYPHALEHAGLDIPPSAHITWWGCYRQPLVEPVDVSVIAEMLGWQMPAQAQCDHANWRPVGEDRKCMDCGVVIEACT